MMFLRMFGLGTANALAGEQTEGTVTKVTTCYWLKVNTKAIRTSIGDGAKYPHVIHFTYQVHGQTYSGKRYVNWNLRYPVQGEKLTVHYETAAPEKYAALL